MSPDIHYREMQEGEVTIFNFVNKAKEKRHQSAADARVI